MVRFSQIVLSIFSALHHLSADFRSHLRQIAKRNVSATELANLLPVKAFEKFDSYPPPSCVEVALGRERLDLDEAIGAASSSLIL